MNRLKNLVLRSDTRAKNSRSEILKRLWRPGCVVCRREQAHLEHFFFWYLHEGYAQPENLERMERSHGFCRRHTRSLLAEGASYNIASIYDPLVAHGVKSLRLAENNISSAKSPEQIAAGLLARGACPACESLHRNKSYLSHLLQATLHDAEVQDAVSKMSAICLTHSLEIAGYLGWTQLRFLADEVIDTLLGDKASEDSDNRDSLMEVIRGVDLNRPYRDTESRAKGDVEQQDYSAELTKEHAEANAAWSPTLTGLRQRLSEGGCLVCRAQQRSLRGYFDWLSTEICKTPLDRWEAALWLCREHGWEFAHHGSKEAAVTLATSIRDYWVTNLEMLVKTLSNKPSDQLVVRLAGIPRRLRERWSSTEGRRHFAFRRELWMAFEKGLKSPKRILPELRDPVLHRRPCPACVYLRTTADRNCDLLVRGIVDPDTQRVYQRSSGLCFRHLPRALSFCGNQVELRTLVRDQRVRLELLQWKLQEYQRKQSWTLRYEPKGVEQTTWRRAVEQYTGSEIEGGP